MPIPNGISGEDFREDCRLAGLEDVHPRLRDKYLRKVEPETAKCRACGQRFLLAHLTDDLLCGLCDEAVAAMEAGRIPKQFTGVPANDEDAKRADDPNGDKHSRPLGEAPCEDSKDGRI